MKKTISIIISIAMCAMLASCGGVKNEVSDTEQPTLILAPLAVSRQTVNEGKNEP